MRYVHENIDGSVALWACVPKSVSRISDGQVFTINTIGRNEERNVTFIRGGNETENLTLVVGDKDYDIADLEADSIPGYTIIFPDFETDILSKLRPEDRAKVKKHRVGKKADVPTDRTFRAAWIDTPSGKIEVDIVKARVIARQMIEREANMASARLERDFVQLQMNGGNTNQLDAISKKAREWKNKPFDPRIDQATNAKELKQMIETVLDDPNPSPEPPAPPVTAPVHPAAGGGMRPV